MIGLGRTCKRVQRFWNWFIAEERGYACALEALMRGEADVSEMFDVLNARLRGVDPQLACDVARTLDGGCELRLSGPTSKVLDVLAAAPVLRGWKIVEATPDTDQRRAPFRVAPRPALDFLATPIAGAHEAWA